MPKFQLNSLATQPHHRSIEGHKKSIQSYLDGEAPVNQLRNAVGQIEAHEVALGLKEWFNKRVAKLNSGRMTREELILAVYQKRTTMPNHQSEDFAEAWDTTCDDMISHIQYN